MKVCFITYGCSYNQADTNIMKQLLNKTKYTLVSSIDDADVIVINGCIVKNPTENKIIRCINDLKKNDKKVIVAGCFGQVRHNKYKDFTVIGTNSLDKINEAVESAHKNKNIHFISTEKLNKCKFIEAGAKPIMIVPIAEGCLGNCTYCATKFARTDLRSIPINVIVKLIGEALKKGTKEFWLTSQDNGCYGHDINTNIVDLLDAILSEFKENEFQIRLGMMNPNFALQYLDDLERIFKDEHMFKFIHIPIQSGNDNILKKMNRKYSVKDFVKVVDRLKKEIKDITIATDIIVGFPTETEKQFNDTYELIEKIKPNIVNISRFWLKKDTQAQELKQIETKTIMKRSKKLHDLMDKISKENNKRWLSWTGKIYIDEKGKRENTFFGRNYAYKNVLVKAKNIQLGNFVNVKVIKTLGHYLIANIIE